MTRDVGCIRLRYHDVHSSARCFFGAIESQLPHGTDARLHLHDDGDGPVHWCAAAAHSFNLSPTLSGGQIPKSSDRGGCTSYDLSSIIPSCHRTAIVLLDRLLYCSVAIIGCLDAEVGSHRRSRLPAQVPSHCWRWSFHPASPSFVAPSPAGGVRPTRVHSDGPTTVAPPEFAITPAQPCRLLGCRCSTTPCSGSASL